MINLENVKTALRISHNKLDSDILETIAAAKAEMVRAGIIAGAVDYDDPTIVEAIKTYCKYSYAPDVGIRDGYFTSWQYQLDCIRKTASYAYSKVTFKVKAGTTAIKDAAITIDTDTMYTNSLGVAYHSTAERELDIDYTVVKAGYKTVNGSVYVNGNTSVDVAMEAE